MLYAHCIDNLLCALIRRKMGKKKATKKARKYKKGGTNKGGLSQVLQRLL